MKSRKSIRVLLITGSVAVLSLAVVFMSKLPFTKISAEVTKPERIMQTSSENEQPVINQDTRFVAIGNTKHVESIMLYPGGYFHLQTEISLNQVYYGRYTIEDGELILSIGDKEYWHFTYLDNELTLVDTDGVELFDTGERFSFEELDQEQASTDRHPSLEDLLRMPFD